MGSSTASRSRLADLAALACPGRTRQRPV